MEANSKHKEPAEVKPAISAADGIRGEKKGAKKEIEHILAEHMWDRSSLVFERTKNVRASGAFVEQFLAKLQKIEEGYGASLMSLCNSYSITPQEKFNEAPAMRTLWQALIASTTERARQFSRLSTVLQQVLNNHQLQVVDKILLEPTRELAKNIETAAKNLKQAEEVSAKVKAKFDKLKQSEFSELSSKKGITMPAGLTADEHDKWRMYLSDKQQVKLKKMEDEYRQQQIAETMVRTVHNETVTHSLDAYQLAEFRRVDGIVSMFMLATELHSKLAADLYKNTINLKSTMRGFDKEQSMKDWCKTVESGVACPWLEKKQDISAKTERRASLSVNPFSRAHMIAWRKQNADAHASGRTTPRTASGPRDVKKEELAMLTKEKERKEQELQREKEQKEKEQREKEEKERKEKEQKEKEKEERERQEREQKEKEEKERKEKEQKEKEEQEKKQQQQMLEDKVLQEAAQQQQQQQPQQQPQPNQPQQSQEQLKPVDSAGVNDNTKGSRSRAGSQTGASSALPASGTHSEAKTPIVIDNGQGLFKGGYAGDRQPSLVIPSVTSTFTALDCRITPGMDVSQKPISCLVGSAALHMGPALYDTARQNLAVFSDQPSNWEDVESVWEYIVARLGADPTDHPILITQPALAPTSLKQKMCEILYESFGFPKVYVATAPMLSAYAYGASTGLVIDIGDSGAQVIPLVDGYLLEAHIQRVKHIGGLADTQRIVRYFDAHPVPDLNWSLCQKHSVARALKDRLSFCANSASDYEDELDVLGTVNGFLGGVHADPSKNAGESPSAGTMALQRELLNCGEALFQPKRILKDEDESIVSVPQLVNAVVSKCDIDTRRELLDNIFLSGGVTMMRNFPERLTQELKQQIPHAHSIRVCGSERRFAAWTGGSVLATIEGFQSSWVTKAQYLEGDAEKEAPQA